MSVHEAEFSRQQCHSEEDVLRVGHGRKLRLCRSLEGRSRQPWTWVHCTISVPAFLKRSLSCGGGRMPICFLHSADKTEIGFCTEQ